MTRTALLVSAALAIAMTPASAQWWNPNDHTPPGRWGTDGAPKVAFTHQTLADARMAIAGALWNDDFRKLDRMYDELLEGNVRTVDGTSMLQAFATVFENAGSS